ncbi:MAG: UbiA family prenyltransferase [Thermodesulfobacteriota bacterium]
MAAKPICVDLDGTLVRTDTLMEGLLALLRLRPLHLLLLPWWLLRGRAHLKAQVAARAGLDCACLPYDEAVLDYLRARRAEGRELVLATGSDRANAEAVANHLGLFDLVLASDGVANLTGRRKADALGQRFGAGGYVYAGNSLKDLPVWRGASQAIVVNAPGRVARRVRSLGLEHQIMGQPPAVGLGCLLKALRAHQWVKNILVLVPVMAAHRLDEPALLARSGLALALFILASAGVYLFNDLMDLEADRRSGDKCRRPLACGDMPLAWGLTLFPALMLAAPLLAAWWLPGPLAWWLLAYLAANLAYSLWLKTRPLVDVLLLAGLYNLRILAGGAAAGVEVSPWLQSLAGFVFLSLVLAKRYVELDQGFAAGGGPRRRGYQAEDRLFLLVVGLVSGNLAVLVFSLYLTSETAMSLYRHPHLLWAVCPLLLYWINRVWLLASRGRLHEDPVQFALRDPVGYLVAGLTLAVMIGASL